MDRYEVGLEPEGGLPSEVLSYWPTKNSAFMMAQAIGTLRKIYVYDRMAHNGKPELWHYINGDFVVISHKS